MRILEDPDLGIPLADGTRLSARMWRPETSEPVPVILEYLPYRKRDGTCARDALTHPWLAAHGYACLRVDIRGNGDSDGLMEDEYTPQELSDAVEVIGWAASQPWCSGRVGMMGISWGGFNGLQVAQLAPEPLHAVVTLCSTVDRYADDIHFKGGCLLNENLGWGATMWSYSSRAPDPALRPNWREMWLERLEAEPFLPALWLKHQTRDAYWKHGSICESYATLKAKVLAIGGWGDGYKNAVRQIVDNIPGAKGILGPWVHKYPHFAVPEPRIGFLQEALRWWDRWLKDIDTGVENDPALRVYQMEGVRPATWYEERTGKWLGVEPHHKGPVTRFDFGPDGDLQAPGPGDSPQIDVAVQSPAHCGADAGEYCAIWLGPELPGDQRADDALSATWDSAPLERDLEITGRPHVLCRLTSETPIAQMAVRLCHVHPDGASTRITYGVRSLNRPPLGDRAFPLTPGDVHDGSLWLDDIAYTVPKGHRLRVAISNAYWPLMWPAPETGRLTIVKGALALPSVHLPSTITFPPPVAAAPWRSETIRPEAHVRRQETDMVTGRVSLVIEDDFGHVRDLEHGLETASVARECWSIHPDDPLSAKGWCHWTDELIRDATHLRTEARCEMTSDLTHFHLKARLDAYEGDEKVFSKELSESIPRNFL